MAARANPSAAGHGWRPSRVSCLNVGGDYARNPKLIGSVLAKLEWCQRRWRAATTRPLTCLSRCCAERTAMTSTKLSVSSRHSSAAALRNGKVATASRAPTTLCPTTRACVRGCACSTDSPRRRSWSGTVTTSTLGRTEARLAPFAVSLTIFQFH